MFQSSTSRFERKNGSCLVRSTPCELTTTNIYIYIERESMHIFYPAHLSYRYPHQSYSTSI